MLRGVVAALRPLVRLVDTPAPVLLSASTPCVCLVRTTTFFNKLPAEHLWKSVTSVSNAGAKKGRGRGAGKKRIKDLNRGQTIGLGKVNMLWPGLNAPVIKGHELIKQQRLPDDPARQEKLIKMRDSMRGFRMLKLNPIERGYSGAKVPGRKFGPPDPVGENNFEGFESICIQFKALISMHSTLGRYRKIWTAVITGNGKGLAGFGVGKSKEGPSAIKRAKNRAGQRLMFFELYDNHTVFHDFFTQFGNTRIFVQKKPKGYGLECHRVVKSICQIVGIKDLHANVEGSRNPHMIVKAFFLGLLKQKTHQQIVEEKGLHLVEYRKENEYFPKVVASPEKVRTSTDPKEILEFSQYCLNGRIFQKKPRIPAFYEYLPFWRCYLKKQEKQRCVNKIQMDLHIERGELKSFLNDQYPDEVVEKK